MRCGFTTGSCAAAAAKAAAYMLLTGKEEKETVIDTPGGVPYRVQILNILRDGGRVSCAVRKDGGDDPDITAGALVYASVAFWEESPGEIRIEAGKGVGTVTRPGLDQPVGSPAINRVPREMIEREVRRICEAAGYEGGLRVEISVPEGEALAEKTFNPRLGIVGGISILGTSGIVEPMSRLAFLDTIRAELRQRRAEGFDYVAVSPGNYGLEFMKRTYGYDLDRSVKCGNFVGETVDMAVESGFSGLLLTGHIGKLIKVAGGIMNTHSGEGDCRMELLAAFAARCGVEPGELCRILDCVSTEEALEILEENGIRRRAMELAVERICFYLDRRAKGRLRIDCILYANRFGELAKSKEAAKWFTLLAQEQAQRI